MVTQTLAASGLAQLEPVAEGIGRVGALDARNRLVRHDLEPRRLQPLRERVQVGDEEARMRLQRSSDRILAAPVELLRPGREPAAAASAEKLGLRLLIQPEEPAVERE